MKRSIALCALLLTFTAHAQEPALYTLQVWDSPSGVGLARTVGPMNAEQCHRAVAQLNHTDQGIPPSMRLLTSQCATRGNLDWWFAAYNCTAAENAAVPRHPDIRVWVYSCFRL